MVSGKLLQSGQHLELPPLSMRSSPACRRQCRRVSFFVRDGLRYRGPTLSVRLSALSGKPFCMGPSWPTGALNASRRARGRVPASHLPHDLPPRCVLSICPPPPLPPPQSLPISLNGGPSSDLPTPGLRGSFLNPTLYNPGKMSRVRVYILTGPLRCSTRLMKWATKSS